jgi:carbamoylphosphate synthase small subunit
MSYFTAFPKTSYEVDGEVIFATDLTAYAEVLDSVRLSSSF